MKHYKQRPLLYFYLVFILFVTGCKDDKPIEPDDVTKESTTNIAVNNWLYEVMEDGYYWYKEMPAKKSLVNTANPFDFFEKLVYQRNTTDRFSMVTDDINALQKEFDGISKIFGIQYQVAFLDDSKKEVGLFLNMVVKGSPSEAAGLKRGDIIVKINGTPLTTDNYGKLLTGMDTAEFTLASLNSDQTYTESSTKISVTRAEVAEDPIVFSSIINKPTYGKVIGYLVYSQFIPGTAADSKKYDNHLRSIFADFKSQGVNELVLDLRYNPGGYLSAAETLGSLIGKGVSSSKVFYKEEWNDKYVKYWKERNGTNALNYNFLDENANIGANLNHVVVLTSNATASCSELIINGLKPYMSVITIGEHTAGKNLFGSLIDDESKKWNWGLYLMLGKTVNANDIADYGTIEGIAPDHLVQDDVIPFKPFGDEEETLMKKALEVLGIPSTTPSTRQRPLVKVKAVSQTIYHDQLQVKKNWMISEHQHLNGSVKSF
jgi:carboxyl-terminal processing protease